MCAYGLHHALSTVYDDARETPRPSTAVRAPGRVPWTWSVHDGCDFLSPPALQLLARPRLELLYWPPPAASHRAPSVQMRLGAVAKVTHIQISDDGSAQCECSGARCVHGCGAVVPRCLEQVRAQSRRTATTCRRAARLTTADGARARVCGGVVQTQTQDHMAVCLRALVPCRLAGFGCRLWLERAALSAHVHACPANQVRRPPTVRQSDRATGAETSSSRWAWRCVPRGCR